MLWQEYMFKQKLISTIVADHPSCKIKYQIIFGNIKHGEICRIQKVSRHF